jgi:hypothetical protein
MEREKRAFHILRQTTDNLCHAARLGATDTLAANLDGECVWLARLYIKKEDDYGDRRAIKAQNYGFADTDNNHFEHWLGAQNIKGFENHNGDWTFRYIAPANKG